MRRTLYEPVHEEFRTVAREFVVREVTPRLADWDEQRLIDRSIWVRAAEQGMLGLSIPEDLGGAGLSDFRFRAVLMEEFAAAGAAALSSGFSVHDDIVVPYLLDLASDDQRRRWLPPMAAGTSIGAIAMTEPGAGSDLQAIRTSARRADDGTWVLDGRKTFITSGVQADLVIVLAYTDRAAGSRGMSLFVVERDMPGFTRGRKLHKIGLDAQDTAELFFDSVRLTTDHLLGEPGRGFAQLMERLPRERIAIAAYAQSAAEAALEWTLDYCAQRTAFGGPLLDLQNTRFVLADLVTSAEVSRAYVDRAIAELGAGALSAVDAAKAKWWATEMETRVLDRCLQLHGGYGYMREYPIARAFLDARIQTIYGGTTEIMKEIIGRDLARTRRVSRQ